MKKLASFFLVLALGAVALAETVKYSALETMEQMFESKLRTQPGKLPFQTLSNASALYVPGVGVMLSARVNLVYAVMESPFLPSTPAEFAERMAKLHQDKLEKVPVLEQNMRQCLADTAGLQAFEAVPSNEQFIIGVSLFYFPKEDPTGLPHLITMNVQKQKLLKAVRENADLATVIQETKQ